MAWPAHYLILEESAFSNFLLYKGVQEGGTIMKMNGVTPVIGDVVTQGCREMCGHVIGHATSMPKRVHWGFGYTAWFYSRLDFTQTDMDDRG